MHPIERLRWIARADGEADGLLATEAAWTLGELAATEPPSVVTAARRLVARHPDCGPLWWACARLVASGDPYEAAGSVASELAGDRVAAVLAEAIAAEFARSDRLAACLPVDALRTALAQRGGYEVRVIGGYRELRYELAGLGSVESSVSGFEPEEAADALDGTRVLLVEPAFASPAGLWCRASALAGVEAAEAASVPVWALCPPGRVLPPLLAEAAAERSTGVVRVDPARIALAVGPSGPRAAAQVLAEPGCPAARELISRFGW